MNNFLDTAKPPVEDNEKRVKKFSKLHNVDDELLKQQVKAKLGNDLSYMGYINELVNSMCEVIAQNEGKTFDEILDKFEETYL